MACFETICSELSHVFEKGCLWVGKCVPQVCSLFLAAMLNDSSKAAILPAIRLFAASMTTACVVYGVACVPR